MTSYDPKTLEAWFRFMAETAKGQAQASEMMTAIAEATSPEAWTKLFETYAPTPTLPDQPEAFAAWTEAYWEAFGFVPKAKYDALEGQYLDLKGKLEAAEREAAAARRLLGTKGQEEKAKAAVDAWSAAVATTLEAQTKWWGAWLEGEDKTSG